MTSFLMLVLGLLLGVVITGIIIYVVAPGRMMRVKQSRLGFEETVSTLEQRAISSGWQVPKIYDLQDSLHKEGHPDIGRIKVISLCQPDHAAKILSEDQRKIVTAMMPCRIGVYEATDGRVMVAAMNVGLMSKLFGGVIQEVMGNVAREEHDMLATVLK